MSPKDFTSLKILQNHVAAYTLILEFLKREKMLYHQYLL